MMKRFVKWGTVLSICIAASTANAQTPVSSAYQPWQTQMRPDLYSRIMNFRFTGLFQEAASPSDMPIEMLPEGDAAESSSLMNGTTFQHYGNAYDCPGGDCGAGCCGWFGGLYAIGFDRSDDAGTVFSIAGASPVPAVLTTDSADTEYGAGFEARFGKYLNSCYAIEAGYWGVFPQGRTTTVSNLNDGIEPVSAIDFDGILYRDGINGAAPVSEYFGIIGAPAQLHRIRRDYEAHNVEINLIRNPCRRLGCAQTHFEVFAGFRYFQLDDRFSLASDINNEFMGDDLLNELHYTVDVDNHLFGFQVGGRSDYKLTQCLSINGGAKFGIYGNHITHRQQIVSGAGIEAFNSITRERYAFDVSDNELSFLGELFVGVAYDVTCRWRLTGGYRAISASGIALSTSQIPRAAEFVDFDRVRATDHFDAILLHGAYAGIEYNW